MAAPTDIRADQIKGGSTFSATPPANPADGDIWIYNGTAGIFWLFAYDSSETTYKWKFVGGGPMNHSVATDESTSSATYVDLGTVGPTLTVPRAGDYIATLSIESYFTGAVGQNLAAVKRGAAATSDLDAVWTYAAGSTLQPVTHSRQVVLAALAASDVIKMQYRTAAGVAHFQNRCLTIVPLRVS